MRTIIPNLINFSYNSLILPNYKYILVANYFLNAKHRDSILSDHSVSII